ncbi:MAG: hypothetical protein JO250_17500 [Armatimonadetes bacterium]|nr:hypothetical protein [Armatimonadota bacterium]
MTLIIDLPPEVESRVREAAQAEGVDVTTYVYEAVAPRLRRAPPEAMSEEGLLAKVREDFPQSFWRRFSALAAKRDARTLTPDEWRELASAADATEAHDAERLYYLAELSRRRGLPVRPLMKDLGLRTGSDG